MGVISGCLSSVFSSCGGPEGIKTWFLFSSGGVVCCSSFCSFLSHSVTVGGGISSCRSFLFLYFFSFSSSLLEDEDEDDDDFLLLLWLLPYSCVSVGVLGFLLTCLLPW
jgi:hypothetical protein